MSDQLSPQDTDIVTRLLTGGTVSPQEKRRIIALAASTPPADPTHVALAKAAAVAHGDVGSLLPSATPPPSAPVAAPAALPTPSGTPSVADVTAKIAAGGYAGSNAGQGGATPPDQATGLGAATQPDQPWIANLIPRDSPAGSVAALLGIPTGAPSAAGLGAPTLDFLAPGAGGNGDPNAPAERQAAGYDTAWGGRLSGFHGIASPPDNPMFDPTTGLLDPQQYAGYTFAHSTPGQRDLLFSDQAGPLLEANALAQQAGGGVGTANMMLPYVQAAMALAGTGALGNAVNGMGATGGPSDTAGQLKAVEDFVNTINGPNGYLDPRSFMGTVLDRMANTPVDQFSKLASLGIGAQAQGAAGANANVDDQITATNNAMQAAGQLSLAPDAQSQLHKLLAMAEIQYKQQLVSGAGPQMTYPAYLQSIGLPKFFQG